MYKRWKMEVPHDSPHPPEKNKHPAKEKKKIPLSSSLSAFASGKSLKTTPMQIAERFPPILYRPMSRLRHFTDSTLLEKQGFPTFSNAGVSMLIILENVMRAASPALRSFRQPMKISIAQQSDRSFPRFAEASL